MPNNPESPNLNSAEENFNNSPWAEELDMDVRGEAAATSTESEKTEPSLADRIRNEMTLQEIEKLDIQNISDEEFSAVEERIKQFDETGNADPIKNETDLPPKVQELKKKAVNNLAFKSAIDNVTKDIKEIAKSPKRIIATLGLTAMIAAAGVGGYMAGKGLRSDGADSSIKNEQYEDAETEIGIKDGYGEEGLYLSENKAGPYNFSCGEEVEKVCDGDHHKELEYVAENQVESLADYIANMPDEVKPEGFEGLTILEAEKKLESLSDEDYEKVMKQFKESVEKSTVKETTIDGECDNAYIYKEDGTEAVHENMELVSSVTTEKNTPIIEYSWVDEDGNVLDTLQVKKVCRQAVNKKGLKTKIYSGMKVITLTHSGDPQRGDSTPTPPEPTPPDNPPQPKNQTEANENSGANEGIVTPEKQERKVTPEPSANEDHPYNQGTNTYDYTPKEQAEKISYEVDKTDNATVGTGEVTGNTPSADGSGNTIQENLDNATGNPEANPTEDYSQGF